MMWGIHMGMTDDFSTAPAHAHLNLAGWTSLAIMGGYYALDRTAPRKLGWANFTLSAIGAMILPLGIFLIVSGHPDRGGPLAAIGASAAFLGMLTFAVVVLGSWRRAGRA
jgi:hypothetical protein